MDTLTAINTRRSVRKYLPENISDELINIFLQAAMNAPSAGNQQPWWFIVVKEKEQLKQLSNIHKHLDMVKDAACAIVVCGDPSLEKHPGYWVQDCSAAVENLLLAVHATGWGAVWCALYPNKEKYTKAQNILKIPENIYPLCAIAIGKPEQINLEPKTDRFKKERIFYNYWNNIKK